MIAANKCIVLSKLKYKDYDLIVTCYTLKRGIVSYILKGVLKSKKSLAKAVYFQELSQLQIEERYKPNQSLQYIKEVKLSYVYKSLHTNVYKSAIVLFLSEVLYSALREEEQNEGLFIFLETAFQYLDTESSFANFHLLFLLKLTRFLGFQPENISKDLSYFNLRTGLFTSNEMDSDIISGENLTVLKQLLGTNFDDLHTIKINAAKRQLFLNTLLHYFELHLEGFKKPKSLQILNEVFH